jgi:hypothetical protein
VATVLEIGMNRAVQKVRADEAAHWLDEQEVSDGC